MNILSKLTIKNLMLNKKRTIGTIIGIVLSSALICAVSGMFASFRETLIKNTIEGSGYYHIALNGINLDKLNSVKLNKDVLDVYTLYELGVANYAVDDEANIDLYVYSLDKDNFDNLAYKIIEGSFPSNSNEVLISENLMERTDLKVGDYIEFDISDSGVRSHKKYKIVGSTYRRRNSTGNLVITTDVKNDNIWAYVALKNVSDYKDSFVELLGVFDYDDILEDKVVGIDYVINNELLRWEVFAFSDNTISMLVIVVAVVICIIVIVSIFCIRNSFAISTTEKMKMYGMLASVGATRKQIRKSVLLEGVLLGIVGIPLGILLGILAVWVLLKIVNIFLGSFLFNNIEGLVFKISVMPILVVVILGFVTIYFSSISSARKASRVSPIDNLRNSEKIKLSANNLTETARNERAMVIVISIFLYGFIMVISLIGVTNIFNTLTSNMELRQKEFAMLKSIGMTKREFRRMINLETLFYSCKSLFYGIILGLIGSYFIYLGFNVHTVRNFEIPYKGILMSIVFVFAIVYIIMRYSMGKINKQNTIETIRNENI